MSQKFFKILGIGCFVLSLVFVVILWKTKVSLESAGIPTVPWICSLDGKTGYTRMLFTTLQQNQTYRAAYETFHVAVADTYIAVPIAGVIISLLELFTVQSRTAPEAIVKNAKTTKIITLFAAMAYVNARLIAGAAILTRSPLSGAELEMLWTAYSTMIIIGQGMFAIVLTSMAYYAFSDLVGDRRKQ